MRNPHDGRLRGKAIRTLFVDERSVVVGVLDALDVAAEVVPCFGEEDVERVCGVEVVGEGGAGDASSDDEAVDLSGGGVGWSGR